MAIKASEALQSGRRNLLPVHLTKVLIACWSIQSDFNSLDKRFVGLEIQISFSIVILTLGLGASFEKLICDWQILTLACYCPIV